MLSRFAPSLALLLAPALSAQGTCLPQGLTIDVEGGRIGDPLVFDILGTPSTSGLMGVDYGGGPVATPVGTICLDLSSMFFSFPISTGPTGVSTFSTIAPLEVSLEGTEVHFQGFVVNGVPPFGLGFSNDASTTFYPPRVYFVEKGFSTPFGSVPAKVVYHDGFTDVTGIDVALTPAASDVLYVPALRCIAVQLTDGTLVCLDDETGAVISSTPVPTTPSVPSSLQPTDSPGVLLAMHSGSPVSPFGPGSPGAVTVVDTIAGTTNQIPLSAALPEAMISIPGTSLAYLRDGFQLIGVDHALGLEVSFTALSGVHGDIMDWLLQGTTLLTLHEGREVSDAAIQGIDVLTGLPAFGSPFPVQGVGHGLASQMRLGPAFGSTAIHVLFPDDAEITVVDPSTLLVLASQITTPGTRMMELSPGGTEWLLLRSGFAGDPFGSSPFPGSLSVMDPATLNITQVASLPSAAQTTFTSLPSATFRKAYVTSVPDSVVRFDTDPTIGPGVEFSIAVAGGVGLTATN